MALFETELDDQEIVDDQPVDDQPSEESEGTDQPDEAASEKPKYMAQLAKDLQDNEYLAGFSGITDLARRAIELGEFEKNAVVIPGEDADETAVNEFYTKLGRPEKADDYEFEKIELPKGMRESVDMMKTIKDAAYGMNMNNSQANAFYKFVVETGVDSFKQVQAFIAKQKDETKHDLKKEWGKDFDENMELVGRTIQRFADESDAKELNTLLLGNDVRLAKMLRRIGRAIAEDKFIGGEDAAEDDDLTTFGDGTPRLHYNT